MKLPKFRRADAAEIATGDSVEPASGMDQGQGQPLPGTRSSRRRGLGARLTWAFVLLAGALLLVVGLILTLVSYNALLDQVILRQQKTASEAILATSSHMDTAKDILVVHGEVGSLQNLLLRSMQIQQEQLRIILVNYPDLFQELALVDSEGKELARVSRYYVYLPEELGSWADSPAFQQAMQGQVYLASETQVPPYSEFPAVVMAAPVKGQSERGVLIAYVSIEGMWDAMAEVQVGPEGYSYLVNRQTGQLLAHSDYASYLRFEGKNLDSVPIVRQLMAGATDIDHQYQGLEGQPVIGAAAAFPDTDWVMVVELPTREALADVRQMLYLLAVLAVVGAVAAASLGLVVPRRIVQPLQVLQEGAQEIGAGRLEHVIRVKTGDEIEDLADTFNQMAVNLRASRDELERWSRELENRVEARTQELAETTEQMRRRAVQLQTSADVARAIASVRDLDKLLPQVAQLISESFGWYHVGIFLLDEAGEYAMLQATNSEGGQRMLDRQHRLRVGQMGIVGSVTSSGKPRIALDVGEDAVFFDSPDLPETRSEMALPLQLGERIIGALDVQSAEAAAFEHEDVALLSNLADQVAVAIQNARLFEQTQQALEEVQKLHRQYVQREWSRLTTRQRELSYEYRRTGAPAFDETTPPEVLKALAEGDVVALPAAVGDDGDNGDGRDPTRAALAAPIKLRDQIIGVLDLQETEQDRQWTDDEIALVQAISDQVALALENARLLEAEQEQRQAAEALREAAVVLSSTLAFDELIQRILDQIGQVIPSDARNLMLVEGDYVRVVNSMGYERFDAQDLLDGLRLHMDDMITLQQMRQMGQPLVIPDTTEYPGWEVLPELAWLRSYLGAPITVRGQLVGLLNVDSATPGFFTQEHAQQLAAFASQAAIALENTQLVEETSRRAEQLATLHRIGLTITSALDLDGVLNALYERIQPIMDADAFYVALYDELTRMIEFPFMINQTGRIEVKSRRIDQESGVTGHILQTRKPLHIRDIAAVPDDAPYHVVFASEQQPRSYLGVPLVFRDEVFGVLSTQSNEPNAYSETDVNLLTTIATQASIAIQNARAYQRLVDTAEQLREVDRLKTQFLANMSHELRTPLNSIIGFSRVMLKGIDGPLNDLQEADLTSIYSSGQHLLSLINSILDMSKIEAGKMDLTFAELSLDDVFNSALATARGLLKDRPVELRSDLPEALPTVWADAQRVRQVLFNLISNAAKFTEKGYIALRATADANFVTISVEDTGIGIDEEARERLFIPFQQVDASTSRRAGGTGLGLAISRSFVEMQGGEIWVKSEPNKGATFSFTLPVYRAVREREEAKGDTILDPTKKVVLAVDDDEGVIRLLKRYLEGNDYQVIGVTQAHKAMDMAQRLAPDLTAITLDVVMPNVDGWQVLRALKQHPKTQNVPVILCSIVDGLDQGLSMGAAACLQKPVTRDEMLDALKEVQNQ